MATAVIATLTPKQATLRLNLHGHWASALFAEAQRTTVKSEQRVLLEAGLREIERVGAKWSDIPWSFAMTASRVAGALAEISETPRNREAASLALEWAHRACRSEPSGLARETAEGRLLAASVQHLLLTDARGEDKVRKLLSLRDRCGALSAPVAKHGVPIEAARLIEIRNFIDEAILRVGGPAEGQLVQILRARDPASLMELAAKYQEGEHEQFHPAV